MPTEIEHISRSGAKIIVFGPFRLMPRLRLLLEHDTPVHIGSRALDLLIALTERPGELITKDELFSRVWPDTFVDPGNLSVHIMALRRILKDGCGDNRYIVNTPGRGYRFVAPVAFASDAQSTQPAAPPRRRHNPPTLFKAPIGREDIIKQIAAQLPDRHLITLIGTGGIGKTTVALAVAAKLVDAYERGVWFVDLTKVDNPGSVAKAIAKALQLEISAPSAARRSRSRRRDRETHSRNADSHARLRTCVPDAQGGKRGRRTTSPNMPIVFGE